MGSEDIAVDQGVCGGRSDSITLLQGNFSKLQKIAHRGIVLYRLDRDSSVVERWIWRYYGDDGRVHQCDRSDSAIPKKTGRKGTQIKRRRERRKRGIGREDGTAVGQTSHFP